MTTSTDDKLVDERTDRDLWRSDPLLQSLVPDQPTLAAHGVLMGSHQARDWAEQANNRRPELLALGARGRRQSYVAFHPHWQRLIAAIRGAGFIRALFDGLGSLQAGKRSATKTQAALAVLRRQAPGPHSQLREGPHSDHHRADNGPIRPSRPLWISKGKAERQVGQQQQRACVSRHPGRAGRRAGPRHCKLGRNVMALDMLRAAQRKSMPLLAWFDTALPQLPAAAQTAARWVRGVLHQPDKTHARTLTQQLALLAQTLLLPAPPREPSWLARQGSAVFGTATLPHPRDLFAASCPA